MNKKMNNKGFSLVELIIVVAIMAVLIGVLAPAYLQYVEKSKKTNDCTTIGSVMDAIEIIAADPAYSWTNGTAFTVALTSGTAVYSHDDTTNASDLTDALDAIVDADKTTLTSGWSGVTVVGTKNSNGTVTFTFDSGSAIDDDDIEEISPKLANRFE